MQTATAVIGQPVRRAFLCPQTISTKQIEETPTKEVLKYKHLVDSKALQSSDMMEDIVFDASYSLVDTRQAQTQRRLPVSDEGRVETKSGTAAKTPCFPSISNVNADLTTQVQSGSVLLIRVPQ